MISYNNGTDCDSGDLSIPILDPGFMRGHVAYEAIRVYEGHFFDFQTHLDRLLFSIEKLRMPELKIDLKKICADLNKKNDYKLCLFRIYYTPGVDLKGAVYIFCDPITTKVSRPEKVCTAPTFRNDPLIKSTHYGPALAALDKAKDEGFDDVLFIGKDHELLELAFSNFFAIKGNELLTPDADVLPGVTRKHILKIADKVGLTPICRQIKISEVVTFDEVFHSNTTKEVMPISQVDDILFPSHEKTHKLHEAFGAEIKKTFSANCI